MQFCCQYGSQNRINYKSLGGRFLMNEEVRQEYLYLREEIQTNLESQRNLSTFSITAVITIIGIAASMENISPEFYLIPYILLLLAATKVGNLRNNIALLVGYMIARIEKPDGFSWETCLNEMRKKKRTNLCKNDMAGVGIKKFLNKFFFRIDRFGECLETQEFTFMAVVCLALFCYEAFMQGTQETVVLVVVWRFVAAFICLLCIIIIYRCSNRYWNMDETVIEKNKNMWLDIIKTNEMLYILKKF